MSPDLPCHNYTSQRHCDSETLNNSCIWVNDRCYEKHLCTQDDFKNETFFECGSHAPSCSSPVLIENCPFSCGICYTEAPTTSPTQSPCSHLPNNGTDISSNCDASKCHNYTYKHYVCCDTCDCCMKAPTHSPTPRPTIQPTLAPTLHPTLAPTFAPTLAPRHLLQP